VVAPHLVAVAVAGDVRNDVHLLAGLLGRQQLFSQPHQLAGGVKVRQKQPTVNDFKNLG